MAYSGTAAASGCWTTHGEGVWTQEGERLLDKTGTRHIVYSAIESASTAVSFDVQIH